MSAINKRRYFACLHMVPALLGLVAMLSALIGGRPAVAAEMPVTVKPIAVISADDDGRPLSYPSQVFYDPGEDEIYLINGGTSRVVVYGPDFFPRFSIGKGRSVAYPRGIHVMGNGQVYIAQGVNRANPVRRVTILNGAFFVDREIFFDEIPEAAGFSPRQLAVSSDGTIYATSDRHRGVMVLDREGNFLRWLKPLDQISDRRAIAETAREAEEAEKKRKSEEETLEKVDGDGPKAAESIADIPEEFRPEGADTEADGNRGPGLGPVRINHVSIDSAGKIYLLSTETSKTYVYSRDENFLFSFGEKGGTPRKLSQPKSLAIDEQRGLVYVADYTRHTVLVYDLSGSYLYEFGGRGFRPGYFNFPMSIAVNRKGEVIVADLFNKRVQVLDVKYDENLFIKGGTEKPAAGDGTAGEAASEAEGAAAETDGVAVPEGGAGVDAAPESGTPGPPDGKVEEVIIPESEPVTPPATDSGQQPQASPADRPNASEAGKQGKPAAEVYQVEPASVIEVQKAPGVSTPGGQPAGSEAQEASEAKPEEPDAAIEEQVIPERKLPAYPDDKPR